jgi:predicted AlkP superfamily pyrophosphatase or phosphodiesterase
MKLILGLLFFTCSVAVGQTPKLIVGIVVDQMCYDYLYRFDHNFSKDGFRRFLNKGVNCKTTTYNYVPTYTGPGHASIYTGTTPSNHGIVANDWYDRTSNNSIYCVQDNSVQSVGSSSKYGKASPHLLETMTVTDQLKLTYPKSKVISMSIKDRGAILPGGHLSNGTYWFDFQNGTFITSTYYATTLPGWVEAFNRLHPAKSYLKDWNLMLPLNRYSRNVDNSPYERVLPGKIAAVFPYTKEEIGEENYSQFTLTPFANTMLTDFALDALTHEGLGKDSSSDVLCISYSTPDIAGHEFGPYSLELEDIYLRLDKELAKLFQALDQQVGKDKYLVFLTADHAVVPVPQQLLDNKLPGGYLDIDSLTTDLNQYLRIKYGEPLILKENNFNFYFNRNRIQALGKNLHSLQDEVSDKLRSNPEVHLVLTGHELDQSIKFNAWGEMLAHGYTKERSGDVLMVLKPGFINKADDKKGTHQGTTHGSAFNYDTHVPLLWFGNGLKPASIYRPISITDISATLVHFLNLQRPASMVGVPIQELWKE